MATPVRAGRPEAGQLTLPLALVVVGLVALGLLFAQVGSAADQRTQTVTVADSAAVAAGGRVRDVLIVDAARTLPHPWTADYFRSITPVPALVQADACTAAQTNWAANPHTGALNCADLSVAVSGGSVNVTVTGPAGELVHGPAQVADQRVHAAGAADVVLLRCPAVTAGSAAQSAARTALAHELTDAVSASLATPSTCFTSADRTVLQHLHSAAQRRAMLGDPADLLDAVRLALQVRIVG